MRRARIWLVLGLAALMVACGTTDTSAPSVSITDPAAGSTVTGGAVTVSGTTADNVAVTSVEVFADGDSVGTTVPSGAAWSLVWDADSVGDVELTASARDAAGNATTSAAVNVTVAPATLPGTVTGYITRFATPPVLAPTTVAPAALSPIVPGDVFVTFAGGRPDLQFSATGDADVGGFTFRADGGFAFDGSDFAQLRAYPVASGMALYRAEGLDEAATWALIRQMRASSAVREAFPNGIVTADAIVPNDPFYGLQAWHYEQLNLPEAWEIEDGSSERVVVAVLDTGRIDHPDIDWADIGANFVGWDLGAPTASEGPIDNPYTNPGGSAHGTHVAGTIAALSDNDDGVAGVNWNVEIVPVKVLGESGSGTFGGIFEGLYWAAGDEHPDYDEYYIAEPARVVNMSLGGNFGEACPAMFDELFQDVYETYGVIAVVSAGNESGPADPKIPSSCDHTITVGATGPTGARAYYSNYGAYVDTFAPGGDFDYDHPANPAFPAGVLSTVEGDGYGFYQGTSMATPHVTGVVSLMLAQEGALELEEVRVRLHNASLPMSAAQCNAPVVGMEGQALCGAGLLDAAAALLGETLAVPRAFAYAVPFEGTAPELGLGQIPGIMAGSPYQVEAVETAGGDFSFELTGLPDGDYLIVGLELRDPDGGIGNTDRIGFAEVSIVDGGEDTVVVVVDPVYLTMR